MEEEGERAEEGHQLQKLKGKSETETLKQREERAKHLCPPQKEIGFLKKLKNFT